VRLPVFKLVQYNHVAKDGRGISPDIFIPPISESVNKGMDRKMEIVKGIIKEAPGSKDQKVGQKKLKE
jgi:hypothetical protein